MPKRSIGAAAISKMKLAAEEKNITMMDVVVRALKGSNLGEIKPGQKKALKPFVTTIAKLKELAEAVCCQLVRSLVSLKSDSRAQVFQT